MTPAVVNGTCIAIASGLMAVRCIPSYHFAVWLRYYVPLSQTLYRTPVLVADAHLTGTPRARTRTSHFAALGPAEPKPSGAE